MVATDSSAAALAVARANAVRLGLDVEFVEGDLLEPVAGPVDAVVSNPPYVRAGEPLAPEIARYEPAEALYAGEDGLEVYRRLVPALAERGAFVALEVGAGQAGDVAAMLRAAGFGDVEVECPTWPGSSAWWWAGDEDGVRGLHRRPAASRCSRPTRSTAWPATRRTPPPSSGSTRSRAARRTSPPP